MKMRQLWLSAALLLLIVQIFCAGAQPAAVVSSPPVYVPDYSHQNEPLPGGVLAWDSVQKNTDATNGQDFARFVFTFTNIATKADVGLVTNYSYLTNFTIVTNQGFWSGLFGRRISSVARLTTNSAVATVTNSLTPIPVTILNVHPSCGCTTAETPKTPWLLPPGTNAAIRINVNLAGKSGIVPKFVTVSTDQGKIDLRLLINIHPAPPRKPMTEAERAQGISVAKVDRQAVFKGDCASCHANNVKGKYAQQLFNQVCSVCHEANPRASMVPDLHNLKDPTSEEFWRAWITSGKPGTLMPAFASSQGGPLDDMQIASLANYLNATIPPHVSPPAPAGAR